MEPISIVSVTSLDGGGTPTFNYLSNAYYNSNNTILTLTKSSGDTVNVGVLGQGDELPVPATYGEMYVLDNGIYRYDGVDWVLIADVSNHPYKSLRRLSTYLYEVTI